VIPFRVVGDPLRVVGDTPRGEARVGEGKVVVVTGASSGIGAGAARALAGNGWRVVLAARRADELDAAARSCGADALAVPTDVTHRDQVEALRDRAIERFGAIDAWVNNAGVGLARPTLQLTDEDVDRMFLVNTKSVLYGMQAVIPHFQQRGRGHVVNVSSVLGRAPLAPIRSAYCAAKAAADSLTRTVRADLARDWPDIHVSLLVPGIVATDFGKTALATSGGAPPAPAPFTPPPGVAPQPVEVVVAALIDLLERPRPEVYTNPASPELVRDYLARQGALA
jgi:NAD(P)-dependent dehydrogenase (short-subunit alcohol dehydrogenase family)